ncbi:MAG: DUF4326 domain-containing protein [Alphaproteobacteria bacterium]|nr:DUF4326 domain-containing protein [Alphaproteobacteria bacterium]
MHKTHLPICTWLIATYLLATSCKGISSLKLASLLGLQYRHDVASDPSHPRDDGWQPRFVARNCRTGAPTPRLDVRGAPRKQMARSVLAISSVATARSARCLAKFRDRILGKLELMAAPPKLRDRDVACGCAPERCHGEVLRDLANVV